MSVCSWTYNGYANRKHCTDFMRTNDKVIIATEEEYMQLIDALENSNILERKVRLLVRELHEEGFSFDQMMLVRHIIISEARKQFEDHLQDQNAKLSVAVHKQQKKISNLKDRIGDLKERIDDLEDRVVELGGIPEKKAKTKKDESDKDESEKDESEKEASESEIEK